MIDGQNQEAATAKARSPIVQQRAAGTNMLPEEAERRRRRDAVSETGKMELCR